MSIRGQVNIIVRLRSSDTIATIATLLKRDGDAVCLNPPRYLMLSDFIEIMEMKQE